MADNQNNQTQNEEDVGSEISSQLTGQDYTEKGGTEAEHEDSVTDSIGGQLTGQSYDNDGE